MDISLKEQMLKQGFVFIPDHLSTATGTEVAQSFGDLLSLGEGDPVHRLVVNEANNAPPNSYGGIYGIDRFPFHTDLAHWAHPPRFLLLRCLNGFEDVPTLLIDAFQLSDQVGRVLLGRALVKPRRPMNLKLPLLRILRTIGDDAVLFRWDEVFLQPCGTAGRQGVQAVKDYIAATRPTTVMLVKRGDTLLVDNWRMLHARSRIPPGCESRCIERAYLGGIH
jgi:L-asparagine oxygenase